MTRTVDLGSDITLPSGKRIRITAPADGQRPWLAMRRGDVWQVGRAPGQAGGGFSLYYGGKPIPVQLDEVDARALAEVLNQVRPAQYPR